MKWKLILILLILIFAIDASAANFSRNLTIGSRGQDVKELQVILNQNFQTRLALSGPGSPGNETTYFGPLTRAAVIKYQELFSKEILLPVGLYRGTGFVGPSTRAKLNKGNTIEEVSVVERSNGVVTPQAIKAPGPSTTLPKNYKDLIVAFTSPQTGNVGSLITIDGAGFEKNNTVYFDDYEFEVASLDTLTLSFYVPDIPKGKYAIEVENSKGKSDTDTFFIIKDPNTKDPVITRVTPREGFYGEEVTISGTGFQLEDNEIRTSYSVIEGIPSKDGKTLKFKVRPYPETEGIEGGKDLGQGVRWDISLNVLNDNGISNRKFFKLKF